MRLNYRVLTLLLTSLFAAGALAMPIHPDIVKQIKSQPPQIQKQLLYVPDGVNQPAVKHRAEPKTHAAAIFLLIDFSDNEADPMHPPADYNEMIFTTETYPTGSMQDYYEEVSYGQFTLEGEVSAIWLRMPQTYAYYVNGQKGFGSYPRNAQKMVEDAIAAADAEINFLQYDSDGDGFVDALFVVHAGPGFEETGDPNMIHSHQWDLSASPNGYYQTDDGVKIGEYSVEPEERASGAIISIGVFCHEFGHVLGLPDLYDYDYDSEGVGNWCIMAGGSWGGDSQSPETPVHFSAWCKKELGWIDPTPITADSTGISLSNAEDNPQVYRFIETGKKYFLMENRQKTGFDAKLYNSGILIWHIDETQPNNDHQCVDVPCEAHYQVALEQADGLYDLENNVNRGDAGDPYPGTTGNLAFNTQSIPNSWDYTGKPTWVNIQNISEPGNDMTFDASFTPTEPFLILKNQTVSGDNDGDGIPEAGETFDLTVMLANFGLEVADVTVDLTVDGPVTVTDGQADYGTFASEQEKDNAADPFGLMVDALANPGSRVALTLNITAPVGFSQTLAFNLVVSPLPLSTTPLWTGQVNYSSAGKAVDIDGNGYPDLVVSNFMDKTVIYWNTDGTLPNSPGWTTDGAPTAFDVLPVDMKGDQFMELVLINVHFDPNTFEYGPAKSELYANTTGTPETSPIWQSQMHMATSGDAGDIDGDNIPDLVIGCSSEVDVVYRGLASGTFEDEPFWQSLDARDTTGVVLLDIDADGDLDLAASHMEDVLEIYINNNGTLDQNPTWQSTSEPWTLCIAAADLDLDGYPEIALGNYDSPNMVFKNTAGTLESTPSWVSEDAQYTYRLAFGDIDNDGYPEMAAANLSMGSSMPAGLPNGIYYNTGGALTTYPAWTSDTSRPTFGLGFADFDDDNDLDLYTVNLTAAPEMFENVYQETCSALGVTLWMPSTSYTEGDMFALSAFLCNPGETIAQVPLIVLLDVADNYYSGPAWTNINDDFTYYPTDLPPGQSEIIIFDPFLWPEVDGALSGIRFWSAMTNPNITVLLGDYSMVTFDYY